MSTSTPGTPGPGSAAEPPAAGDVSRAAAGMGLAAAASRLFGAGRVVVIAAVLGTTYLGNAFQAANSVSNVLFELLAAGALSAALVPAFVDLLGRGQRRAEEVAGSLLACAWLVLGAVTLLGIVGAPLLARILTSGVSDPVVAADQRDLATYLLRFFVPQVLLYALGAVTTAVLHARRRFAAAALAPIGNTVVLVAFLAGFRALAGADPGLDLSGAERLSLALGGTLGVAAFVAVPAVALRASGFRLRFSARPWRDPDVRGTLRVSGWAGVQHAGAAVLLGSALVAAGGVEGGVVAYQFAMVVFLAPYGVLAQPVHTAMLPTMAEQAALGDRSGLRASAGWAGDAVALVTLPVTAMLSVLALPVMRVLAFGEAAGGTGPDLLAGALAGLGAGVTAYGAHLLLSRVAYAVGDTRSAAVASLGSAVVGASAMLVVGATLDGSARLAAIGLAHSASQVGGAAWLARRLRSRIEVPFTSAQARMAAAAAAVAGAVWVLERLWSPQGRVDNLACVAVLGALGTAAYLLVVRAVGAMPTRAPAPVPA